MANAINYFSMVVGISLRPLSKMKQVVYQLNCLAVCRHGNPNANILKILTIYTRKGYFSQQVNGPNEVAMVQLVIWEISMAERGVCTIPCCAVQFRNFPAHYRVIRNGL
jgi:hypothetical protein